MGHPSSYAENTVRAAAHVEHNAIPPLRLVKAPSDDGDRWRTDPNVVIMERLRDGDIEAFQVLFIKHNRAVIRLAYRILRSHDHAEEIAQTVFLNLFLSRERYQPTARFTTFLYRVTINVCFNELRRFDYSGKIESLDVKLADTNGDGSSFVDRLMDNESNEPASQLACREVAAEIVKVLERVPSHQRRALLMSRVDGFTHQEIAERLHSSRSAVKSMVFRATAALRKELVQLL